MENQNLEKEHLKHAEPVQVVEVPRNLSDEDFVNLQMVMMNSSMSHEYVLKAYESSHSFMGKQDLSDKLSNLRNLYFSARDKISASYPERLGKIVEEILQQKLMVLREYSVQ